MSKIETSLLADQVYKILRSKIITVEYKPGDKLDIHKLADEFGVSRSPVKDAINQLVYEGLIEIIPRKGTYVTELDFYDFLEVLDARLMIELWAAHQIIQTVSIEKIEKWGQIVNKMDLLLENTSFNFEKYNKLDMQFHSSLIEWTGNKKIQEMFSSLNTHVSLSRIVHSTSLESTIKRHRDHWLLYEAMKSRDFPTFSNAITGHIGSIKQEAKLRWNEEEN
ncbi:GntR family transcriptional regulator [Oceanobacillus arenosus]|uniref:GntR family transcriptional regulator n=1 Tax=Oceanobacillus arenosus TaxID=1229153 RepID=A0A3D8PQH7_9BACI|nr:GntR family transcriptional regulator [Oceanobacillus arenosus]RDW18380.1 GntR family transcriptional regulator [Oceanobacillus arenosus]